MNNHAIRIARLTDRQIVDLIIAIQEGIGFDSAALGFGSGASENIAADTAEAVLEKYRGNRHAILSFDVRLDQHNVVIRFRRGVCSDSESPDTNRQASPYFDELFLCRGNRSQPTPDPDLIIKCLDIIKKTLHEFPRALEGQGQDVVDALRVEMSDLNETYRNMLRELADERNEFLKGFEEQRQSVEEERRAAREKIEAEAEQRQKEFQKRMESEETKLSQRQAELDAKEQELDNRQHMHVRRDLREKIIEEFKRRGDVPIVPQSARRMRWGVFCMSLIAGVVLFWLGLWAFYLFFQYGSVTTAEFSMFMARSTIPLLVGSGLFFYAIRWLRSIYLEDVRTIRHYDSYRDDIDRASFAIETIMEISNEKEGVTAPDAWIEGVCRNLFRSGVGDKAESSSQADAFIELLRSISSASVGPNGAEFTLDRKGGKRLAKTMNAGGE